MHLPRSQPCSHLTTTLAGPSQHGGQHMAWAFILLVPYHHDVTPRMNQLLGHPTGSLYCSGNAKWLRSQLLQFLS